MSADPSTLDPGDLGTMSPADRVEFALWVDELLGPGWRKRPIPTFTLTDACVVVEEVVYAEDGYLSIMDDGEYDRRWRPVPYDRLPPTWKPLR